MILALVISGVVLGRRALWLVFASLMVMFASGFFIDAGNTIAPDGPVHHTLHSLPSIAVVFALIAMVLDRYNRALRQKLHDSVAHGFELQREMDAREKAQARLVHAQKMEATGRLASGIAHDFNNILDVIMGYATQRDRILEMESQSAQEAAMARVFSNIESAAARGMAITRKLLAFNRHELARPQVFDVGQAIAEMQPMLRQLLPRSICLELPRTQDPLYIRFDRSEFELMVLNIAANARDAMAQGGQFSIAVTADAGSVCIALVDTGHGMDRQLQQRIFEPFFSTKSATEGTGLGLAVIQDMILAAGGDISVESTVGQGSTFLVRIPAAHAPDGA
jgi:signal transduction histidine kinase